MLNVTISSKIKLKSELIQKYFPCKKLLVIHSYLLSLRIAQTINYFLNKADAMSLQITIIPKSPTNGTTNLYLQFIPET